MSEPRVVYTKTDPARVSYDGAANEYYIQEGFAVSKSGKPTPRKFRLGQDEVSARERALRIRQLWASLKKQGQKVWTTDVDSVAFNIAKGNWQGVNLEAGLAALATTGKRVAPDAADADIFGNVDMTRYWAAVDAKAKALTPIIDEVKAGTLPQHKSGKGLHRALDLFAAHIEKTKVDPETHLTTPWGHNLAAQVRRHKDAIGDMSLTQFKEAEIAAIINYWKSRPCRKGTNNRIDVTTVIAQIKALRYFLKWLPKNAGWKRADYDDLLTVRKAELIFKSEVADLANGVSTWSVTELQTLYRYATPWERVFILCGLNLGFAQAEICTLRKSEIKSDLTPPLIKRIRQKSTVYGELSLWSETVTALQWAASISDKGQPWAIMTDSHKQLTYTQIANIWNRLIARIRKDNANFRFLPFKYLRKTAAQMMQDFGNHYIASVSLFHGKKAQDGQLSAYTNADFRLVFETQAKVRTHLATIFEAVPNPFEGGKQLGGANISLGVIERIRQMAAENIAPTLIAKTLKISRATVYRWLPKPDKEQ